MSEVLLSGVLVTRSPVAGFDVAGWVHDACEGGLAVLVRQRWAAGGLGRPSMRCWGEGWFPPGAGGRPRDRLMSVAGLEAWLSASLAVGDSMSASVTVGPNDVEPWPKARSALDSSDGWVRLHWGVGVPDLSGGVREESVGLVDAMGTAAAGLDVICGRATIGTHGFDNQLFAAGFFDDVGMEPFVLGARAAVFVPKAAIDRLDGLASFSSLAPVERIVTVGDHGVIAAVREDFSMIDDDAIRAWKSFLLPILRPVRPARNYYNRPRLFDVLAEDWEPV